MTENQKTQINELLYEWEKSFPGKEVMKLIEDEPVSEKEKHLGGSYVVSQCFDQLGGLEKIVSINIRPTISVRSRIKKSFLEMVIPK